MKTMKALWIVLPISLVLLAFWFGNGQASYQTVSVQDLANAEPNHFILDVRQPEEFAAGHVPNAVLIPLGELQARVSEVPRDVPVYVICRSGNRSRQASDILVELGFQDVRNVDGGIMAWQAAEYPTE